MGGYDDAQVVVAAKIDEDVRDSLSVLLVQRSGRLVRDDDRSAGDQGASYRRPLLLTT